MLYPFIGMNTYVSLMGSKVALVLTVLIISALIVVISSLVAKVRAQKHECQNYVTREKKYKQIIELTEDVVFEYDIQTDVMSHSERYKTLFGRNPIIYNYTEALVELPYVHEEDQSVFQEFCQSLHIGKSKFTYEFRLANKQGSYEWCHVNGSSFCENMCLPNKVLGRIINIDAQKIELERLRFKAQRDLMTNVYNKKTVCDKINETIQKGKKYERHALFVIDIDDFKHVNDTYGHLKGDYVLTTIVTNMVKNFREEDIVGRIGGDEFVALMKNVSGRDQIVNKAESICKIFNRKFIYNDETIQVSCSIGIAIYPMDGCTYDELVEHADQALYEVKSDGKNSYMLYCDLNEEEK